MMNFINKFKIPTLLGISIILLGLASGVYLVLREQIFFSQAAPNLTPQNITQTNITEGSIVISWQTSSSVVSFITFGQNNPSEQTVLDDRDSNPTPHLIHYVTLKNLLPKTTYQYKIMSGKFASDVKKFQTAGPVTSNGEFTPIIGSVLDGNIPVDDGVVYLSISGAFTQSSLVKSGGNFLIPLSQIRKEDLSDIYPLAAGTIIKLTIRSDKGEANILSSLKTNSVPLPGIKLGQNIDLTAPEETPAPSPSVTNINKYDLNNDGKVNSIDYLLLPPCLGKKPSTVLPGNKSCIKADINDGGTIDKEDQDLMTQKLKELSSQ